MDDIIHGREQLLPRVISAEPHRDYTLTVTFTNGERRVYNASQLFSVPMYRNLRDVFMAARAEYGTVIWPGDIDISPETLYLCGIPLE